MFYGNSIFNKLLSGGERLRLKLSKLLYNDVNMLVLDEPTNHLDTNSIESIEEALTAFKGTIFFISHDRYFINKICNRVIAIEYQCFQSYPGNYDDYKNTILKRRQPTEEKLPVKQEPKRDKQSSMKKQETTKEANGNQKNAEKIEREIENLESELREIEALMETLGTNYEELNQLYERKEVLNKDLEKAMEAWLGID